MHQEEGFDLSLDANKKKDHPWILLSSNSLIDCFSLLYN
jgi:hypothetical protein